jgi:hypothetical protein
VTIICAWHKPQRIVLAEKCPTCGCSAIPLRVLRFALCVNPNCSTFCFPLGHGGTTDTICDDCKREHFGLSQKSTAASA